MADTTVIRNIRLRVAATENTKIAYPALVTFVRRIDETVGHGEVVGTDWVTCGIASVQLTKVKGEMQDRRFRLDAFLEDARGKKFISTTPQMVLTPTGLIDDCLPAYRQTIYFKCNNDRGQHELRSENGNNTDDPVFKLDLIGDSGVGKSCILFRFIDDSFNESLISTIGIDCKIKTIEVNGRKIKLQIRNTTDQQRFHASTTPCYRDAVGIMLVYDVTQARSFENITKWLRHIDDHASKNAVKILLGNKCDIDDKRCITLTRGEALAREHAMPFLETSAKTGFNIGTAFLEVTRLILNKARSNSNDASPGSIGIGINDTNRMSNH